MTYLIRYDEMRRAIEACHQIDEVKDIRDKALAFEHYSRQAKDIESERQCIAIRLRAERKAGQLLKEMTKAPAGRPPINRSSDTTDLSARPTLSDMGISKDQSSKWQQLADVPEEKFEAALAEPAAPPSTAGILRQHGPKPVKSEPPAASPPSTAPATPPAPPGFTQATKAIGRFHDFALYCRENDPEFVAGGIYDYEIAALSTDIETVKTWLDSFSGHLKRTA